MSERTTIGGVVYEAVGSSSSNLLLKCNGTARIQWGNKLIDLVKNGKIVSTENSTQFYLINNESEIIKDGIYILDLEDEFRIYIRLKDKIYNLTESDLYISATNEQNITSEQKEIALKNIGMYYNTLKDVEDANIKNGIVYILEDNNLYIVKNGIISEFEAKVKTIEVEETNKQEDKINGSVKLILSVLDDDYIILENNRITANYDVHVKSSAQLGSEGANEQQGYRLFVDQGISKLEVDEIKVRNGIPNQEYIEVTYNTLIANINTNQLQPHKWYLVTDYQNPWKLPAQRTIFNRPILIRALTSSSFYSEGTLFQDRRVIINFDPFYFKSFSKIQKDEKIIELESPIYTKGCITWMKDANGNEANFDFLDYTDYNEDPLATLYESIENESLDASIFPNYSYNNKINVHNLKGLFISEDTLNFDIANSIDFKCSEADDLISIPEIHDNFIDCRGFILTEKCKKFCNNTLIKVAKLEIETETFNNNNLSLVYCTEDNSVVDESFNIEDDSIFTTFKVEVLLDNVTMLSFINSKYYKEILNSTFERVIECIFYNKLNKAQFKNLTNCIFGEEENNEGVISDLKCYSDISDYTFIEKDLPLLYDTSKIKEMYYNDGKLQIFASNEQTFVRGMIVMHSGITPIPVGWAICDGSEYIIDDEIIKTPDLRGRFIKAAEISSTENMLSYVKETDVYENNQLTLTTDYLPKHNHPHKPHAHTFEGSGNYSYYMADEAYKAAVETNPDVASVNVNMKKTNSNISISGVTDMIRSEEENWIYKEDPTPITIEPNYYSLIFIMKL